MMSKGIAFFDFDGTLTRRDSLADFLRFALPWPRLLWGSLCVSPVLARYALGLLDNNAAKEKILGQFLAGQFLAHWQALGDAYGVKRIPQILRSEGLARIQWHQAQGHEVVIVSASARLWLEAWARQLNLRLLCTELQVSESRFTGHYAGFNCHGEEKVRRIRAAYDLTAFDEIYAYGDTSGDRPMLALASADKAFYQPFR
jgi:HAD superfamily hydrolase (TIGR01490 family)